MYLKPGSWFTGSKKVLLQKQNKRTQRMLNSAIVWQSSDDIENGNPFSYIAFVESNGKRMGFKLQCLCD